MHFVLQCLRYMLWLQDNRATIVTLCWEHSILFALFSRWEHSNVLLCLRETSEWYHPMFFRVRRLLPFHQGSIDPRNCTCIGFGSVSAGRESTDGFPINVGIAVINHPFLMVYTTRLWSLGGWFIIAIPTLEGTPFVMMGWPRASFLPCNRCNLAALQHCHGSGSRCLQGTKSPTSCVKQGRNGVRWRPPRRRNTCPGRTKMGCWWG